MNTLPNPNALAAQYRPVKVKDADLLNFAVKPLHHAAQFIALAGKAYLAHEEDDSHTNMAWDASRNAYVGRPISGNTVFSVSLRSDDLTLEILDKNENKAVSQFALDGLKKEDALEWLRGEVAKRGLDPELLRWDLHYDIPDYEFDHGKAYYLPDAVALQDLAAYRSDANIILGNIALRFQGASEVRVWPHHFDSGIFIPYETDEEGNVSKGIYAGWNIADEHVPEPYYYITFYPWDHVKAIGLPGLLSKGYWHTEGFYGIFLKSTVLAAIPSETEQLYQIREFFNEGLDKAIRVMKTA